MAETPAPAKEKPPPKPGLLARMFPPLAPEQVALMAQYKLPCC
ncbi:MAG: hypothetical protein R3D65_17610 [Zhengella sp.]